jgi:hypothetical protein
MSPEQPAGRHRERDAHDGREHVRCDEQQQRETTAMSASSIAKPSTAQ